MTDAFIDLPAERQVDLLAELATRALGRWGLEGATVDLLKHRENTVFRITAGEGTRYVMRVHRAHYHSDAALLSELRWLDALRGAGVATTEAIRCLDGEWFARVASPGLPEGRQVDMLGWVPGKAIGSIEEGVQMAPAEMEEVYRQAGEQAARIHNVGESWQRPEGFERIAWDERGFYGETGSICGCFRHLQSLTAEQRALLDRARDVCDRALGEFGKSSDRYGLVHGDFLPENLFWDGSTVRLIDWDDTGFGWHIYDFATAMFPHLVQPSFDTALGAMVEGYRSQRPLPDEHLAMLPVLVMARALSYVGWAHTRGAIARELEPIAVAVACQLAQELTAAA